MKLVQGSVAAAIRAVRMFVITSSQMGFERPPPSIRKGTTQPTGIAVADRAQRASPQPAPEAPLVSAHLRGGATRHWTRQ